MTEPEVPVLVAGGGPVGLTLALELGRRGLPCLLVEQRAETTAEPRCTLVNMRSMEHYRRLGIAEAIRAAGVSRDYRHDVVFATRVFGHELCPVASCSSTNSAPASRCCAWGSEAPSGNGFEGAAGVLGLPLRVVELPDLRAALERKLLLVRPDQHVAWRSDTAPADPRAVLDRVRGAAAVMS
jgi:hypothetical protein